MGSGDSANNLPTKIKNYIQKRVGKRAVAGSKKTGGFDCYYLIHQTLKSLNAKTAADFGVVTPSADYMWGKAVGLKSIKPGYILQFRDHKVKVRTEKLGELTWSMTSEVTQSRPHHSAIVVDVRKDGSVVVVEQNVRPNRRRITRNIIARLADGEETTYLSNSVKVVITVTGNVKAYQPVSKPKRGAFLDNEKHPFSGDRRMLARFIPADGGPKRPIGTAGIS